MPKYSIGLDFGTLSARSVIVDIETGEELASSVYEYEHKVISNEFINGKKLPQYYALQHPGDYLNALYFIIKDCIETSGVNSIDIIGVGVDFTSCTLLCVDEKGTPLCFFDEFKNNPHAYAKLWKHHSTQKEADEINKLAKSTGAKWLKRYGGAISCESVLPKILETLRADENIYNSTFRFIEAGDWIVWQLTGNETHSVCAAGFKATWEEEEGYPDKEFLKHLDSRLENITGSKLSTDISLLSQKAGTITKEVAKITGLCEGTTVMPASIDAHAALPALGVTKPGKLVMILGTSSCHIILGEKRIDVPGILGCVKNGIIDGLYAFESGQACVGDAFDWFVKNCVPHSYYLEAEKENINIHKYLREKAKKLSPGSNGIIALDWWNGNRTPFADGNLSGMILGLTLSSKPEEIYRALIESTAYGTRNIIEIYEKNGIKIDSIYATGGISEKDEMLMQIYADVTGREIYLSDTSYGCAHGSAIFGAVNENGYATVNEASEKMKRVKDFSYKPDSENHLKYNDLYEEYKKMSVYFAKENNVMKKLKEL